MKIFYLIAGLLTNSFYTSAQIITPTAYLSKGDSAMIAAYNRVQNNKETVTSGPVYDEYCKLLKELDLKRLNSYSYKEHKS